MVKLCNLKPRSVAMENLNAILQLELKILQTFGTTVQPAIVCRSLNIPGSPVVFATVSDAHIHIKNSPCCCRESSGHC